METKAGRLTVKKSEEESPSPLPAEIWALIISTFCPHQDLRNCLAVNKFFRDDVPPFIKRLYIFNAHELHLGYAAKFPNVELAYVYALTSFAESGESGWIRLCLETARNVVAFLECFPKLKYAHIGGYAPNHPDFQKISLDGTHNDLAYMEKMCVTDGHQDAFRGMLQNFCIAFERASLHADRLKISGIFDAPWFQEQLSCSSENRCLLCPRICQTFDLAFVAVLTNRDCCVPKQERCLCVYRRDADFLKKSNILRALLQRLTLTSIRVPQPPIQTKRAIIVKMDELVMRIHYEDETLEEMEFLCRDCGCDASNVPLEGILEHFSDLYNECSPLPKGWKPCISREQFDRLSQIGFRLVETEFSIVLPREGSDRQWLLEKDTKNKKRSQTNY